MVFAFEICINLKRFIAHRNCLKKDKKTMCSTGIPSCYSQKPLFLKYVCIYTRISNFKYSGSDRSNRFEKLMLNFFKCWIMAQYMALQNIDIQPAYHNKRLAVTSHHKLTSKCSVASLFVSLSAFCFRLSEAEKYFGSDSIFEACAFQIFMFNYKILLKKKN